MTEVGLGANVSCERCALESLLFDRFAQGRQELYSSFDAMGSENMEAFACSGCVRFLSITRDFVNCRHNESRS